MFVLADRSTEIAYEAWQRRYPSQAQYGYFEDTPEETIMNSIETLCTRYRHAVSTLYIAVSGIWLDLYHFDRGLAESYVRGEYEIEGTPLNELAEQKAKAMLTGLLTIYMTEVNCKLVLLSDGKTRICILLRSVRRHICLTGRPPVIGNGLP